MALVDDSANDRFFMKRAVERTSRLAIIRELRDGQEIIDYLSSQSASEPASLPDVVLLDIKMPRKNGYEVLEWLKTQSFPNMIVVVLSDSALPDDISKSLALGARAHLRKNSTREAIDAIVRQIEELADKNLIS